VAIRSALVTLGALAVQWGRQAGIEPQAILADIS